MACEAQAALIHLWIQLLLAQGRSGNPQLGCTFLTCSMMTPDVFECWLLPVRGESTGRVAAAAALTKVQVEVIKWALVALSMVLCFIMLLAGLDFCRRKWGQMGPRSNKIDVSFLYR